MVAIRELLRVYNEIYRWSNYRRVPYEFSSNINADGRENILEAIHE